MRRLCQSRRHPAIEYGAQAQKSRCESGCCNPSGDLRSHAGLALTLWTPWAYCAATMASQELRASAVYGGMPRTLTINNFMSELHLHFCQRGAGCNLDVRGFVVREPVGNVCAVQVSSA